MALTYARGFWECRKIGSNTYYPFCFIGRESKPSSKWTHACRSCSKSRQRLSVRTDTPSPEVAHGSPTVQRHSLTWHPAARSRAFSCYHHLQRSLSCMDRSPPATGNGTWNSLDTEWHLHTSPLHNTAVRRREKAGRTMFCWQLKRQHMFKCLLIWLLHLWDALAISLSTGCPFLSAQWCYFPIHIFS